MRGWRSPVLSKKLLPVSKGAQHKGETQTFPWASFHLALYFNCSNVKKILKSPWTIWLSACFPVVFSECLQGLRCGNIPQSLASLKTGLECQTGEQQQSFGLWDRVTQTHRNSNLQNSDRVSGRGTDIKFCSSVNTVSPFSLKDQFLYSVSFHSLSVLHLRIPLS